MHRIRFCIVINLPAAEMARKRVTKRRIETRARLLEAAYEIFADEGFGKTTIEQVCERAGYTRGAFYSNFASLDELFLEMWAQKSAALIEDLRLILDTETSEHETLFHAVARVLDLIPIDDKWFRISSEFTAHALRNPSLRRVVADREDAIVAEVMPVLEVLLQRAGRTIPDRLAMGQALVAVHDGTAVQCLIEPDSDAVRQRRVNLFAHVVHAYSTEIEGLTQ